MYLSLCKFWSLLLFKFSNLVFRAQPYCVQLYMDNVHVAYISHWNCHEDAKLKNTSAIASMSYM